jgi:hypothetical protein
VASVFGDGRNYLEGVGHLGQGGPAVPRAPAADLMLVQAAKALAGLEVLFDGPAAPGDPDQGGQEHRAGCPAAVEGQLTGGAVAAHQQSVLAGLAARMRGAVIQADKRPVVQAVALGAAAGGDALPGPRWDPSEEGVGAVAVPGGDDRVVAGHRQHIADPIKELSRLGGARACGSWCSATAEGHGWHRDL